MGALEAAKDFLGVLDDAQDFNGAIKKSSQNILALVKTIDKEAQSVSRELEAAMGRDDVKAIKAVFDRLNIDRSLYSGKTILQEVAKTERRLAELRVKAKQKPFEAFSDKVLIRLDQVEQQINSFKKEHASLLLTLNELQETKKKANIKKVAVIAGLTVSAAGMALTGLLAFSVGRMIILRTVTGTMQAILTTTAGTAVNSISELSMTEQAVRSLAEGE